MQVTPVWPTARPSPAFNAAAAEKTQRGKENELSRRLRGEVRVGGGAAAAAGGAARAGGRRKEEEEEQEYVQAAREGREERPSLCQTEASHVNVPGFEQQFEALLAALARKCGPGMSTEFYNHGEADRLLNHVQVLGLLGSGGYGTVFLCKLDDYPQTFALKLEPTFHNAVFNPTTKLIDESEQNHPATRELLTYSVLHRLRLHERQELGRSYSEMTLHTARAAVWGVLFMRPTIKLSGLEGVPGLPADTLRLLDTTRTWKYVILERVYGGQTKLLRQHVVTLLRHSNEAAERFLAAMLLQLFAQQAVLFQQRRLCHNDLHGGNVCWQPVEMGTRVRYLLPGQVKMTLPLDDTVAPVAVSGSCSELGTLPLLFRLIDWGMSSAQTVYMNEQNQLDVINYGPTHLDGGEHKECTFEEQFDFAKLLTDLDEHVQTHGLAMPPNVRQVLRYVREREAQNKLTRMAARYPWLQMACNGRRIDQPAPGVSPLSSGSIDDVFLAGLFAQPLFARYRAVEWTDADLAPGRAGPFDMTMRTVGGYDAASDGVGVVHADMQVRRLKLELQPIDGLGQQRRAKVFAQTAPARCYD